VNEFRDAVTALTNTNMQRFTEEEMQQRARKQHISYLDECRKVATIDEKTKEWCFEDKDWVALRFKFRGFVSSIANEAYDVRISGCCDRADQY
tara:strand:- start:156 stop:434 length:279 start_codon:yes stop_codon:yes gene_type:complete